MNLIICVDNKNGIMFNGRRQSRDRLGENGRDVRSIDIADYMNFSKPSVSRAVGLLKKDGYILVDGKGYITFTEEGRRRAEKIYERHKLLTEFFITLGVDPETAAEDACRLEHVISDVTFEAIKKHAGQKGL